ncbi:MAG: cytochrome c3 family protein [Candidatus Methanoperedens sp.]|nr:cytochrome c3 family protein [Candidatus Methanoperedens sp.]
MVKKMDILRDRAGLSKTRLIILVFVVLSGIAAALLYFPPILTHTEAQKTSGEITFIDSAGNPLTGAISLSGDGVSSGPPRPNVNLISWHGIPGTIISYDDFATRGLSINLWISGDSPKGRVVLENYGINQPASVNVSAPGTPVKYVEVNSSGVSFSNVDLSIKYTDAEVKGLDVNNLTIYKYDGAMQVWSELPTKIDVANNILGTTVNSLSVFAVVAPSPEWDINVIDTSGSLVNSTVEIFENNSLVKSYRKVNNSGLIGLTFPIITEPAVIFYSILDFFLPVASAAPDNPKTFKIDAIPTKNAALKLENASVRGKGKVILDDYGKKNPVPVPVPGKVVKFVEISAENISFSSAEITIHYSKAELNNVDERTLVIYHWNVTQWEQLETIRDITNSTLSAGTVSLSPFAISGQESLVISHPGEGISDCVNCHDVSNTTNTISKVDVSAMNSSSDAIHKNLNRNATNTTQLSDLVDKACWACHTNGTEFNTTIIVTGCVACHNATVNLTYTDTLRFNDLSAKKIYNHIPANYTTDIYKITSDFWNSSVDCAACHIKSMGGFNTSGFYISGGDATDAIYSNISHYATNTSLIKPSTNCSLCHKSSANATDWYANLTRHPAKTQAVSFCANCHNDTNATTLHFQPLRLPWVIHGGWKTGGGFDWENNSATIDGAACYACHGTGVPGEISANLQSVKLCENCHINVSSIFTGPNRTAFYSLRSDINDTLPYVYSHTNYSNITGTNVSVSSQGGTATYPTTCYAYNAVTGEGTCHAAPYFNKSNFGGYYAQYNYPDGPGDKYDPPHWTVPIDRMPNTTNCLFCHSQSNATIRKGWGNATQVTAGNMFGNRYAISNDSCYTCHTRNQSMPMDLHSNEVVLGGGPGCLDCHNNSNPQNFTGLNYIDGANFSISVHANMNSNNASGYGINASCWACHNSSGYVVANNTHPDKRDTPYTCPDCHLANGSNAGAYNATIISNHYRNGTNIRALDNRTSDLASCLGCHENVSGMITANNDTDYGSFASDGVGVSGGNMSFYHYGFNRSNFGITAGSYDYCIYCHRNATGEFSSVFQDNANRSISNHSLRYNSSNPSCSVSVCHNSTNSSLHGAQLIKPNINITLYNSTYCLGCHGLDASNGTTNYTGAVTTYKEMHNNSVNCTECHTGPDKKNIHPMTYLQPNGTYDTGNQTAVNCTDCHQQNTLDSQLSRMPPKVSTVQHGNTSLNSSFWNGTQEGYWTNTSQESMCDYCHGDSRHNATGLGRPSNWSGSNIMNSSITSNGNWCAGCHYQGYSNSEKFNINMTQAFTGVNLSVPPEITNSSTYSPYNLSGYYNHSLKPDYNDTTCKGCHGKSLSTGTISEFMHNINTGLCTSCHFSYDYMNGSVNKPDKYVNSTMFFASPHGSLACEDCHTRGHNDIGARKACEDCHAYQSDPKNETDRHNITSSPSTYNYNGINVVNITDCTVCHDSSYYNNATATYGYNKTIDCNYCHTYPDKTYS